MGTAPRLQDVGESAAVGDDAVVAFGQPSVDDAVLVDDAGQVHLGDDFDDPRTANTRDAGPCRRGGECRVVGPQVAADHLVAWLERRGIDPHALDRARRGTLSAADLRAFERRAGRARAREQALAVSEHDLRIGADVDEQRDLCALVRSLGQDHAGRIRADVAGDARQDIDACIGIHCEPELRCGNRERPVDGERERRSAEFHRIDAEHEVMHDRIADERELEDVRRLDARLAREPRCELAQGTADRVRHQDRAAGIHHRVGHPAHQVFAEPDLGVHHSAGGDELAGLEIAEMRGDRRRADIDGHAECLVVEARPHGDDLGLAVHRHGHFPLALAQHGLQFAQHRKIAGEPGELPFLLERVHQAPQVAGWILHVRLLHFDVVQADDRIQLDLARIGILAHDLAMDLAAGRNVHDHVALHERRAGKTVTGRQPPPARVALLDFADGGNARCTGAHAVLGEFALGDHDLAASADSAPAADRIDVDAERARGLQEWSADRESPAPAGRHEDDER